MINDASIAATTRTRSSPGAADRQRRRPETGGGGLLWPALILILLAVSGCSFRSAPRSELLGQSYHDIQLEYLEPMPARVQALATLRQLSAIDDTMTVNALGQELVLRHRPHRAQYFPAPAATDWRGWGKTAADVTAAAAAASPAISQLSSDALDAVLIRGTLTMLDRYSRYIPPHALSQNLLVEGSDGTDAPAAEPSKAVSAAAAPRPEPSVRLWVENDIALARIDRFTSSTGELLRRKLASSAARAGNPRGVILDLRDNPGGDIAAAIEVVDLFLTHGIIVTLEARNPAERQVVTATHRSGEYRAVPLVVLINGASASAAEIVAAALQENGRALVVGSPSFGKGTVQTIFTLANGGELWVTSAYARAPSGYLLQHHGVLPDICATMPELGANAGGRAWRFQYLLAEPRPSLREQQWAELRLLCPPASSASGADRALRIAAEIIWDRSRVQP